MLLDAHVDKGAGGGQRGLHLSEAVLHSLEELFLSNMLMDVRVIEVADFKIQVKYAVR